MDMKRPTSRSLFLNPTTIEEYRHNLNLNQIQDFQDLPSPETPRECSSNVPQYQVHLSPRPKFSSIEDKRRENVTSGPMASSSPFVQKLQPAGHQAMQGIMIEENYFTKTDEEEMGKQMPRTSLAVSQREGVILSPVLAPNPSERDMTAIDSIPKVLLTEVDANDQVVKLRPPSIENEDDGEFDMTRVNTFGRKIPMINTSLADDTLSKSFKFVAQHAPKLPPIHRTQSRNFDSDNLYASVKYRSTRQLIDDGRSQSKQLQKPFKNKFPSIDSGIAPSIASNEYFQHSPHHKSFKPSLLSPYGFKLSVLDNSSLDNVSPFGLKKNIRLRPNETRSMANRNEWRSRAEFFLSCLSLTIGLPLIFRFPSLVYQYGGLAFLAVYSILLLVLGLPLFYLECAVGQLEGLGPCGSWPSLVPLMSGLGSAMATMSLLLSVRYSTLTSYSLLYLMTSFYSILPWSDCQAWWGPSTLCEQRHDRTVTILENIVRSVGGNESEVCHIGGCSQPPSLQFFERFILELDPRGMRVLGDLGGVSGRLVGCQLVVWGGVGVALLWGVARLTGRIVMVTATLPLILLPALLARLVTVEGGVEGILDWMGPSVTRWEAVYEGETWREAGLHVMYGLGVVWGVVTVYGSHASIGTGLKPTVMAVCCIHLIYSIVSACVAAASLGHLGYKTLIDLRHLLNQTSVDPSESLPLMVYSESFSLLPLPNLWCILFFSTVMLASVNSLLSLGGVAVSGLREALGRREELGPLQAGSVALVGFLASIPCSTRTGSQVIKIMEVYGTSVPGVVIGIIEVVTAAWIYGTRRLSARLSKVTPSAPGLYFQWTWTLLPVVLLVLLMIIILTWTSPMQGSAPYPAWAHGIGIFLALLSLGQVLLVGVSVGGWNLVKGRGYWLLGAGKGFGEPGPRSLKKCINSNSYKSFGALDLLDVDQRMGSPMLMRNRERKI